MPPVEDTTLLSRLLNFYNMISDYLAILFIFISIAQYLYYNKFKVYVFVSKLMSRWKDTDWDITITYVTPKTINPYKELEDGLKEFYCINKLNRLSNSSNNKIYTLNHFILQVMLDQEYSNENNELLIHIPKLKTTYKHANDILDEIERLSKLFAKELKVIDEVYNINIRFVNGKNPFLGFMLQRLGKDAINNFICELNYKVFTDKEDSMSKKHKANVYKDYLSITQKDFADLNKIAKKILLLK